MILFIIGIPSTKTEEIGIILFYSVLSLFFIVFFDVSLVFIFIVILFSL